MQANPRERLTDAAREVLGEKGYDAATVREISLAARVPQGLIHYYFGGKDGLLAELLIREAAVYRDEQERISAAMSTALEAMRSALARRRRRVARDPAWHRLRFELFALGLRKPDLTERLAELLGVGRSAIGQLLDRFPGRGSDNAALASVVLACVDGLALQKLADPSFDLDGAYEALESLLKEAVE